MARSDACLKAKTHSSFLQDLLDAKWKGGRPIKFGIIKTGNWSVQEQLDVFKEDEE